MALHNTLAWGALMAGALVITYTFAPSQGRGLIAAEQRVPAADFKLTDQNGVEVSLSDYQDKVVLLNFWATWCAPCRLEIPWFVEFEKTYRDRGFAVVGVSFDDEGWSVVQPFLAEQKMNYRILMGNYPNQMPAQYEAIQSLPTTFLIDRQGKIAAVHTGLVRKSIYAESVETLLAN